MDTRGYSQDFMGEGATILRPQMEDSELSKFETHGLNSEDYWLDYTHYSVLQNPFRKFPYYSVCSIDGSKYQDIRRAELFNGKGDRWAKDDRIPKEHQWGHELYRAERSDFDKGHLTKRQDTQWGQDREEAIGGAESTFYFTNAMPQVDRLNRGVWRRIEDYILHQEVVTNNLKITVFTGPVFTDNDPEFVTKVKEETVTLPCVFFKVVYYKRNDLLYRTGFMTRQRGLLAKRRIIRPGVRGDNEPDEFMSFKDAETYQVRVDFIEKLSKVTFTPAKENYSDSRPEELILKGIDVRSSSQETTLGTITNLTL